MHMLGERPKGLPTFARRELLPAPQQRGASSVYLPMQGFLLQDIAVRLKRALGKEEGQSLRDLLQIRLQENLASLIVFFRDVDLQLLMQARRALQQDLELANESIRQALDQRGLVRVVGLSDEPKLLGVMTAGASPIWSEASIGRFQPLNQAYVCWLLPQPGDWLVPELCNEGEALECLRRFRYCPGVLREVLL
ncbi:MAG TPA: hypothetical protein VIN35_14460 [Hydrogenophaga sp.]